MRTDDGVIGKFVVKGSPEDLDAIQRRLSFTPEKGRLEKFSDISDLQLPETVVRAFGDQPPQVGTTRLEIEFEGNLPELKASILQRFPKVTLG